jgi:hypothetical protein
LHEDEQRSPRPRGDLLDALDAVPGARARIYLAPEQRVMFVSLNKNACTSLKWMMASIVGEDLASFQPGLMPFTHEHDSVHNRRLWKVLPGIGKVSPELRAGIHPDNGWFVFAVVRDPRARMFSAWQNKLLLENPGYTQYRDEPWYPRHPLDTDSVLADFERFVTLFEEQPEHRLRRHDPHFRDQTEMLILDHIPFSKIYDIREMGQLREDIGVHLARVGWTGELLFPNANDTPLRPNAVVFANGLRERVEAIYHRDFEVFGDRWDYARIESAAQWTQAELTEAEWRAEYGRRIGDLRNAALHYKTRLEDAEKHAEKAAAQAQDKNRRIRALEQRLAELEAAVQAANERPTLRDRALTALNRTRGQ